MKCVLNISLLFIIAILGCSMTMQAERVVEYGYDVVKTNRVYSYPNTDIMLCFDSDSTILCGTKGNTEFQVWKYRLIGDTIKVRQWLSCDYINERTIVKCNYDNISVTTFLADVSNEYDAEILYKLFGPAEASFVVNDTNILFGFSENQSVYPFWKINEHSFVCTNAGISDFYNNLSHAIWSPYECYKHPVHSIPSHSSREKMLHSGNKIRLYYSHEELLYAYKFLSDYPKKKIKKFGSLERVRLVAEGENLYFEPILIESAEVDRELFITIIYDFSAKRWVNEVYITDVDTLKSSCYLSYSAGNNEDVTNKELRQYYEMISPYINKWKAKGIKKFKYEDEKSEYFTFAMHLWLMPNDK